MTYHSHDPHGYGRGYEHGFDHATHEWDDSHGRDIYGHPFAPEHHYAEHGFPVHHGVEHEAHHQLSHTYDTESMDTSGAYHDRDVDHGSWEGDYHGYGHPTHAAHNPYGSDHSHYATGYEPHEYGLEEKYYGGDHGYGHDEDHYDNWSPFHAYEPHHSQFDHHSYTDHHMESTWAHPIESNELSVTKFLNQSLYQLDDEDNEIENALQIPND